MSLPEAFLSGHFNVGGLAPNPFVLFSHADHSSFPQFLVVPNFRIGEAPVFAENNVKAQAEDAQSHYQDRQEYHIQCVHKVLFEKALLLVDHWSGTYVQNRRYLVYLERRFADQ